MDEEIREKEQPGLLATLLRIPYLFTIVLIVINVVTFLVVELTGGSRDTVHMLDVGAAYAPFIQGGEGYRLFTCMFLHFGIDHLANNMVVLGVLGERLERVEGHFRFLLIYLLGGLGGSVASYLWELRTKKYTVSAGASGAVFALMGAILFLVIRNGGKLLDLSMKRVVIMVALSVYLGFVDAKVDVAAHLGGLVCGFALAALLDILPLRRRSREAEAES